DAETESQDRCEREAGRLPESAPGVANVAERGLETGAGAGFPRGLLHGFDAAHRDRGGTACLGRIEAPARVLVGQLLEVAADLVFEIDLEASPPEERLPEAREPGHQGH